MLVLEDLEHARARGAKIYAELAGYGATSDGHDMVAPSGEGATRCMQLALGHGQPPVDYINPHGTSTPVGDLRRSRRSARCSAATLPADRVHQVADRPLARRAGVQEAIYSLLMMNSGFICESANIETLDPASPTCRSCASAATT